MAKQLAYHVHVTDEKGAEHVFGPDDRVPGWAQKAITNPSAWAEGGDTEDDDQDDVVPYKKWKKADLEAEVTQRNADRDDDASIVVGGTGTVADLATALDTDDEAQSTKD